MILIIAIIVLAVVLLALIAKRPPASPDTNGRGRRRDANLPVAAPLGSDSDAVDVARTDAGDFVPGGGDFGGGGSSGEWDDASGGADSAGDGGGDGGGD